MTHKRLLYLIALVSIISILAVACSPAPAPTSTPIPSESSLAEDTPAPEFSLGVSGLRTFVIDSDQSSASYVVDEEFLPDALSKLGIAVGRSDTVGTTPGVEGQLELNLDDLSAPLGENTFRSDLSQLTSAQSMRDQWLQEKGPQFSQFPDAIFVATSVENTPESYVEGEEVTFQLVGDLTIREITKPATFEVVAKLDGNTLSGTATANLLLTDFGIQPPDFANTLRVQDEFQARVDFVAIEQ